MLQSTNKIIPQKTKTFPLKSQFCQVFCHLRIKSSKKKIHDHGNYRVIELAHPEFPSKTIHYIFCEKQTLISSFPKLQLIKQQSIIASRMYVGTYSSILQEIAFQKFSLGFYTSTIWKLPPPSLASITSFQKQGPSSGPS